MMSIARILGNETACHVKLADLCDNMNLSRIEDPTEKDEARIKKYNEAAERIMDVLRLNMEHSSKSHSKTCLVPDTNL